MGKKKAAVQKARGPLRSLSPTSELNAANTASFPAYQGYLNEVFQQRDIHNLAVSGNLGAGKSSIIRSYDRHRNGRDGKFLYISLIDFEKYENAAQPSKGSAPSENKQSVPEESRKDTQNRVEYSLLCQILTRCRKKELRDSRLQGVPEPAFTRSGAILGGIFAALIFVLIFHESFGLLAKLLGFSEQSRADIHLWLYLGAAALLVCIVGHFLRHGKLQKIKLKSDHSEAEMVLSKSEPSLDLHKFELVHAILEIAPQVDYTIVFEDMDRIDPKICISVMTKLRDLNVLVNSRQDLIDQSLLRQLLFFLHNKAGQWNWVCWVGRKLPYWLKDLLFASFPALTQGRSHIRFLYAVGEDVLNHELRTKFFDCILPVIPVLNPYNAEMMLCDTLKQVNIDIYHKDVWPVIRVIHSFIHDYRTMATFCNEFQVLRAAFQESIWRNPLYCAQLLKLTFYKVLVPKKYAAIFEADSIGDLPLITAEDFPDLKNAAYSKALIQQLNDLRPSKDMLAILVMSETAIRNWWSTSLLNGCREQKLDTVKAFSKNNLINFRNTLIDIRVFDKEADLDITTAVASYIYLYSPDQESFDEWFYAPGVPGGHKFTNCIAFLTTTGDLHITVTMAMPQIRPAELFDWCIESLPALREDPEHTSRWTSAMVNLLETIFQTKPTEIPVELWDIPITENLNVGDIVNSGSDYFYDEANENVQSEQEMLRILNCSFWDGKYSRQQVSIEEFSAFCLGIFQEGTRAQKQFLSSELLNTAYVDISLTLMANQVIENNMSIRTAPTLIQYLFRRCPLGFFPMWLFQDANPSTHKFEKIIRWMTKYHTEKEFTPRDLFTWCIRNLEILLDQPYSGRFWTNDMLYCLCGILQEFSTEIPASLRSLSLRNDATLGMLLDSEL